MHAILSTYVEVYRLLLRERASLVRSGIVMCLAVMGFWALCTYAIGWTAPSLPFAPQGWGYYFLGLWFSVLLAVRWHRLVLLGDHHAKAFDIRPGARELRFLVRLFLIGLASGAAFYLVYFVLFAALNLATFTAHTLGTIPAVGAPPSFVFLLPIIALQTTVVAFVLARLGLILPATAADRSMSIRQSWRATTAHGVPFFALIVLVDLPAFVVESGLYLVEIPEYVSLPLYMAVWWITIAATATALSFNYMAVLGRPESTSEGRVP